MVVCETPRLTLRYAHTGDAAFVCELLNDPEWLTNIGDRGVRTPADAGGYIRTNLLEPCRTLGFGMYVVEQRAGGAPIGLCGLVKREALEHPDLGFALLAPLRGRGYAEEAARGVMAHAREALRMRRLLAIVLPGNERSRALLARLGFAFQRTIRLAADGELLQLHASELGEPPDSPGGTLPAPPP